MKKLHIFSGVFMVTALAVTGCSTGGSPEEVTETVTVVNTKSVAKTKDKTAPTPATKSNKVQKTKKAASASKSAATNVDDPTLGLPVNPDCTGWDSLKLAEYIDTTGHNFVPGQVPGGGPMTYDIITNRTDTTQFSCRGMSYAVFNWSEAPNREQQEGLGPSGSSMQLYFNGYPLFTDVPRARIWGFRQLSPTTMTVTYASWAKGKPQPATENSPMETVDVTYYMKDGQLHAVGHPEEVLPNKAGTINLGDAVPGNPFSGEVILDPPGTQFKQFPWIGDVSGAPEVLGSAVSFIDPSINEPMDNQRPLVALACTAFIRRLQGTAIPSVPVTGPQDIDKRLVQCSVSYLYHLQNQGKIWALDNPSPANTVVFEPRQLRFKPFDPRLVMIDDKEIPRNQLTRWVDTTGYYVGLVKFGEADVFTFTNPAGRQWVITPGDVHETFPDME